MKKTSTLILLAIALLGLQSCNSNDDDQTASILDGTGITLDGDVDCCSAEEALQVYKFLKTVKIIPELSTEVDGKYNVFAYSKTGKFSVGYNEIYFVAVKKGTGNYVKNFDVTNLSPLMTMTAMNMKHSTPVGSSVDSFNDKYLAVKRGWVSFLMASTDKDFWVLSYDVKVLGHQKTVADASFSVEALPQGQTWLQSFKTGDATYFISLVDPQKYQIGSNSISAYVSKKSNPATQRYVVAEEVLTIEIVPTMPDMGAHSSPSNEALTNQADGTYQGLINLTITGYWKIDLTVKDKEGNVIAENIHFDVTI